MGRSCIFIFILLGLNGCHLQLSKQEKCRNILPVPALPVSLQKAVDTPYFSLGNWPRSCWWQDFGSQTLSSLIETAFAYNPNINEVRARVEEAKQLAVISRSRLFPLIYFNFDETWTYLSKNGLYRALNPKIPLNADLIDLTLSFTYEFDFWGKNANLFYADMGRAFAQIAEVRQAELIISTGIAQAYFALKTNLVRKHIFTRLVEITRAYADLESFLKAKALSSELPPLFAGEKTLEMQKLLLGVEDEISAGIHMINALAGRGPDCPFEMQEALEPLPATLAIPCDLSMNLVARRPDLKAQIWRVEALSYDVGAAIADFYPDFNLGALLGLESVFYSLLFRADSSTVSLKPAISLPIFTAGAIAANVGVKKARFDEAVFQYNALVLRSVQEVADVLSFGETVYEQQKAQEQIVGKAKERYELTAFLQEKGLANQLETWNLEIEFLERELERVVLLYNQYVASVKLIKALGGGYASL